jgi:hypothetical protein
VTFEIFEANADGKDTPMLKEPLKATVSGGQARVSWEYVFILDSDDVKSERDNFNGLVVGLPEFYFLAKVADHEAKSALLLFKRRIEWQLVLPDGTPVSWKPAFSLQARGSGTSHVGEVTEDGFVRMEDVPPGDWLLEVEGLGVTKVISETGPK